MQNRDTEPNLKYYLEDYFNIVYINQPYFISILWLQLHPESLVLESFLETIPNLPNFLNSNHVLNTLISPDFTWSLTTTISPISIYLDILILLLSSLCMSLLSETRMLKIPLCMNRSSNVPSKLYNVCCPYDVPSLDLYGDIRIGNGKLVY